MLVQMKPIIAILILLFAVMAVQISCKKANETEVIPIQKPPIALDSILTCYKQRKPDSADIRNSLLGKWQWTFIKCYWNPENANSEDYKTHSIEFKQNDSVEVKVNGQLTQKSSWKLTKLNDGYYKLSMNPIVVLLPGKVLFCGDQVLFYDSYVDGCDNYFKRLN